MADSACPVLNSTGIGIGKIPAIIESLIDTHENRNLRLFF
jgi:hypothetical protein